MGRAPCCSKVGLMRGPWSAKEDALLTDYIQQHGEGQWRSLPKKAGLLRCGKSCRLRWMNYLRPGIKRGNIGEDEEDLIVRLHGLLGNRWSLIAGRLPGRTDNEIKNHWNTHLLKKLQNSGINPKKKSKNVVITKDNDEDDGNAQNPKKTTKVPSKNKSKSKNKNKKSLAKDEDVMTTNKTEERKDTVDSVSNKVKVYLPKATRVCSVFPRTESLDSLASGAASSASNPGSAGDTAAPVMTWKPAVFELGDTGGYYGGACGEDGGSDFLMPLLMSCDVDMLDVVYDEYLQLLSLEN